MADHLTQAWIILMILTIVSMNAGRFGGIGPLGDIAVLLITLFKGRQVLIHFLEIRRSHFGWLLLFSVWLFVVACASLGAAVLTRA